MQKLNLNDLLRYGFSGAVFLVFIVAAFDKPQILLEKDYANGIVAAALIGVGFTVGCILYTAHRAVPYPFFYYIFSKVTSRNDSTLELDITRWKNLSLHNSLQPRMGDWGSQVHFLYCLAWSGFSSLTIGNFANWTKTDLWLVVVFLSFIFLLFALLHHFRYQKWEKRVFEEDAKLDAS